MFCKKINLLILFAVISGCSVKYNKPVEPKIELKSSYGIWKQEQCSLSAKRADVNISLTDIYKEEKVRILLSFNKILSKKPELKIYGFDDYDFEMIGSRNVYSFEIPTSLIDQARMHLNQAFIEVTYNEQDVVYNRKAIFSLNEFPKALLDIKKNCK